MPDHTINHVAFVIDSSGSMRYYEQKTREVFDNCIRSLRESSVRWGQETRVSVYVFDDRTQCKVFDMDVTRVDASYYQFLGGQTSLNDAVYLAFEDSKLLPQKYGDHAFIIYALTDGEENSSRLKNIEGVINDSINKGNYVWSVLVPSQVASLSAQKYGYPKSAIEIWDVSEKGIEEVGERFKSKMEGYYEMRSRGLRTTSSGSFSIDLASIKETDIIGNLDKLSKKNFKILVNASNKAIHTKRLCEDNSISYINGNCFYEIVKKETVQSYKKVAIQSKKDDAVYSGDDARKILGLPNHEVKLEPGDHGGWNVFIQSTAPNRNIIPKQRMMVLV